MALYSIPLVKYKGEVRRINEVSKSANKKINEYLNLEHSKYTGFDFYFKPYSFTC